jgi:excisionase family DNA binding protein
VSAPQMDDDKTFFTPREVATETGLHYQTVLAKMKDGTIPSQKFGERLRKVPGRWVRENRGSAERVLHVLPAPAPAAAPDYGPLASVLEILGAAMVQAAGALRGSA